MKVNLKGDLHGELTFKGLKVDELDLTNKIEGQVELDISQRASFNVKYSNDNLHCMAKSYN